MEKVNKCKKMITVDVASKQEQFLRRSPTVPTVDVVEPTTNSIDAGGHFVPVKSRSTTPIHCHSFHIVHSRSIFLTNTLRLTSTNPLQVVYHFQYRCNLFHIPLHISIRLPSEEKKPLADLFLPDS